VHHARPEGSSEEYLPTYSSASPLYPSYHEQNDKQPPATSVDVENPAESQPADQQLPVDIQDPGALDKKSGDKRQSSCLLIFGLLIVWVFIIFMVHHWSASESYNNQDEVQSCVESVTSAGLVVQCD